jgi:hypothetical protein
MCRVKSHYKKSPGSNIQQQVRHMQTLTLSLLRTIQILFAKCSRCFVQKHHKMQKSACSDDNFILEHAPITTRLPSAPCLPLGFIFGLPRLPYSPFFRPSYIICYTTACVVRRPRARRSNLDFGSRTPSARTSRVVLVFLLPPDDFPQPRSRRHKWGYQRSQGP